MALRRHPFAHLLPRSPGLPRGRPNLHPRHLKKASRSQHPKSIHATQSCADPACGASSAPPTPTSIRPHLHSLIYRKHGTLQLQPPEREILTDYYRADILKLQTMLNRDSQRGSNQNPHSYPPHQTRSTSNKVCHSSPPRSVILSEGGALCRQAEGPAFALQLLLG